MKCPEKGKTKKLWRAKGDEGSMEYPSQLVRELTLHCAVGYSITPDKFAVGYESS